MPKDKATSSNKRINTGPVNRRTSSSSSDHAAGSSSSAASTSSNNATKYPELYWFWLLLFVLPVGFACTPEVIDTFDACLCGRNVSDPSMTGPWKDPLATFIYITCELLIPLTPFGGFGGNRQVQFWGKRLSRNKVIAEIVTYATGVPAAQAYDHKHISSHKQTIIKSLLIRYGDEALDDQLREDAARALRQIAGATPASRFLASYLRPVNTASANIHVLTQLRLRSAAQDFVTEYRSIGPVEDRERPCRNHPNVLRLHPFLALFLGLDGNSSADASRSDYMAADRALAPGQAIANFARTWWDSSVMTADADRKVVWVERWYANRELTIGRLSDEEFYSIHGEPPASNGGLVQGRFARAQQ